MKFLSLCSGIEAASTAWGKLNWEAVAFSEIEPFPSAVLAHHYPNVPNLGDMTKYEDWRDICVCDPSEYGGQVGHGGMQRKGLVGRGSELHGGSDGQTRSGDNRGEGSNESDDSSDGFDESAGSARPPFNRDSERERPDVHIDQESLSRGGDNRGDNICEKCGNFKSIDLVCGGTPCQSFSVAGLRKGLDDPRGNLMLTFGLILAKYRPRWFVWENVPGVLSSDSGRDFASFLELVTGQVVEPPKDGSGWRKAGAIGGIDSAYGVSWRVFDAQFTRTPSFPRAVPQRRQRVFVVGHLGDWRRAGAVLLDSESLSGNPAPSRKAGQKTAGDAGAGVEVDCAEVERVYESHGHDARYDELNGVCPTVSAQYGTGGGNVPLVAKSHWDGGPHPTLSQALKSSGGIGMSNQELFAQGGAGLVAEQYVADVAPTLNAAFGDKQGLENQHIDGGAGLFVTDEQCRVRRLTECEAEKLQAFPPGHTQIPWKGKPADQCPAGARYKAIGNSWATNCAEWIGIRIQMVDDLFEKEKSE